MEYLETSIETKKNVMGKQFFMYLIVYLVLFAVLLRSFT